MWLSLNNVHGTKGNSRYQHGIPGTRSQNTPIEMVATSRQVVTGIEPRVFVMVRHERLYNLAEITTRQPIQKAGRDELNR